LYLSNTSLNILIKKIITWLYLAYGHRKAKVIFFISEHSKKEFLNRFKIIDTKIDLEVVHLGVSELWRGGDKKIQQEKYGVMIGNMRPHKNMYFVANALEKARDVFKLPLYIVGNLEGQSLQDGKLLSFVESLDWIHYMGSLSDPNLIDLVKNSSVLIAPSLHEGFGLTVLEGMAAGVPVLASNIPAHREVGGETVHYFDPLCEESMMQALCSIFLFESKTKIKIENAFSRSAVFKWQSTVFVTLKKIEKLI
jgi:glycosyltransferase involved in cell wall biosynthesis